ncbi:MAG: hypothetical protein KIT10_00575 [Flavobacteriales bacterium]|nr:hypothetical protein [Flavobacteriales bacterium]
MAKKRREAMDPLTLLDPRDLDRLLTTDAPRLPGTIMRLNHAPRYHNLLDAIAITCRVLELRKKIDDRSSKDQ